MEAPQEAEVDFSEVFSVDKIAYNAKALNYCRVFVAIISGCAAGILGQTGLLGFLTFFITTFLLSLTLYMKVKGDPKPYFKDAQAIWTEGVVQSLMSCAARNSSASARRSPRLTAYIAARRHALLPTPAQLFSRRRQPKRRRR